MLACIAKLMQKGECTMSITVKVGDIAPDFILPSSEGNTVSLADYLGKKFVVLYFYPKDNTPGCTKEACSFRDLSKEQKQHLFINISPYFRA